MKLQKRIMLGAALIGVGIVIFFAAFAMGGFDIMRLSTQPELIQKEFVATGTAESIRVEDGNMKIVLGVSPDNKVRVSYFENEKEYYEISDSSTLTIKKRSNFKWYDHFFQFNINRQDPSLRLLVPKDYAGSIAVRTSNGAITVQGISAKELALLTSNGRVIAKTLRVGGDFKVESNNGEAYIEEIAAVGDVKVTTSNGQIACRDITAPNLTIDTSNGLVQLDNVDASDTVDAESSNGEIHINKVNVGRTLKLKSSNGAIHGGVVGKIADFTVTSKTNNGSNNLPESATGGDKLLDVSTSNGMIRIEFQE